jgi:acyl carrier protein/GNAT superfamily N-acetyltransferase
MTSTLEPVAVEQEIARIIRDELLLGSEREIPLDQPLGELGVGLDSLALVNLLTAVEAAFQVELSDDIWTERGPLSVNDLAEIVRSTRPVTAPTPSAQAGSAVLHGRMEQVEERLRRRGSLGRAAWAVVRMAAPVRRFLFARTQHVLLERRLDEELSTEIAPLPGIEFRVLLPGERPDLSDLWAPVHARRMTNVFQQEADRGAIALVACSGDRVVAVDLFSGSGGLDVEVSSPGACFGFLLAEARASRGLGIGLALTAYSFGVARERGFRTQLTHVWTGNTAMLVAATQLLGFRIIGNAQRMRVLGITRWSWQIRGKRRHGRRLVL